MKRILQILTVALSLSFAVSTAQAQGVTTSGMNGYVTDSKGDVLPGATVVAVHTPSGTQYGVSTNTDGRFNIPAMRVGGPYKVTITFVGYKEQVIENINLTLGNSATLNVKLADESTELSEIEVTADRYDAFGSDRTGAGTNISTEAISSLPTINRSINDFTRLTPQANGRSFSGQDSRFNNISIDGAIFNNSFGLSDQPGGRTGQSPISLDAIQEIQVNLAPYDVRQAGFTGAGINAVTRSGTNDFSGSAFYTFRNNNFLGTQARGTEVVSDNFDTFQTGFRLGGPIIKNKLFFFINGEIERETRPATQFLANRGENVGGNVTRVLASDLDDLSDFLRDNFNYETGPYDRYDFQTRSDKFLVKFDYNINNNHRASIRYSYFTSENDILLSNSSSLGRGSRRSSLNSLNFANSNYGQTETIHSVIGELNSTFGSKMSNNFIIGYTYQNEDRKELGSFFPLVEILDGEVNYTTFGFEPFTPSNQLRYSTFQVQNNFTYYANKHTITAGFNLERLSFENLFFPGSQGVWVFNSLADWYTAANAFIADPNITVSPVTVNRFQYRFSALPGGADPIQPTRVTYTGLYLQDEYAVNPRFNMTYGIRFDIPFFDATGFRNPGVEELNFLNEFGQIYQTSTDKLPDPQLLISPRIGFNWDVFGNKTTQVRGGTGIFTGRPPFVWISNQIGNNGVLTGFIEQDNTTAFPFNPDASVYAPENPAAELPTTFNLATTATDFKFPQIWRTNIAVDQKLPFGLIGTVEFIYNQNINAVRYINSNLEPATAFFPGPDNRPVFPGMGPNGLLSSGARNAALRINDNISDNTVLINTDQGFSYNLTFQLDKPFSNGFFARVAYTYGFAQDLLSAGSIASGSFTGIRSVRGNNDPDLAFSNDDQRHRFIAAVSYRKEYGGFGATEISAFMSAFNQGRYTYSYAGDYNGDGINNNDLLFIPEDVSQLNFLPLGAGIGGGNTNQLTPAQQAAAFNFFIESDEYLRSRRGTYAERNGAFLPRLVRTDISIVQDFYVKVKEKRNTLQFRADILNFGNMLNKNWGVSQSIINSTPLAAHGVVTQAQVDNGTFPADRLGQPVVRYQQTNFTRPDGTRVTVPIDPANTRFNANITDVWQLQLSIRYIFN